MAWHIAVPSWSASDRDGTDIKLIEVQDSENANPPDMELLSKASQPVNQKLLQSNRPKISKHQQNNKSEKSVALKQQTSRISAATPITQPTEEVQKAKLDHKRERQREKRRRKRQAAAAGDVNPEAAAPDHHVQTKAKKVKKTPIIEDLQLEGAQQDEAIPEPTYTPAKKPKKTPQVVQTVHKPAGAQQPKPQLMLQQEKKLKGARFRWLNERLYTIRGEEALDMMQQSPDLFEAYHEGFSSQVRSWPVNPVDVIISELKTLPKKTVIADFGCGDAKIAASIPHRVHSFDLQAVNERVVACDVAHVPLDDTCADVVVFCLALMGTNLDDFLAEAYRVLKIGGQLKIAEVRSRFDEEHGGLEKFERSLHDLGFDVKKRDISNKMFVRFDFVKSARKLRRPGLTLKACIYKRR